MKSKLILSALFALTLSACQSAPTSGAEPGITIYVDPDTGQMVAVDGNGNPANDPITQMLMQSLSESQAPEPLPEEEMWSTDEHGNQIHLLSGGICPMEWGSFTRERTLVFAPDGTNVGCNYNDEATAEIMTFYFYRSGAPIEEEFEDAVQQIQDRHPGSREVSVMSGAAPSHSNFPYMATGVDFSIVTGETIRSGVWLMEANGWRLKMRVTYPAANAAETQQFVTLALRGQFDRIAQGFTPRPDWDSGDNQST